MNTVRWVRLAKGESDRHFASYGDNYPVKTKKSNPSEAFQMLFKTSTDFDSLGKLIEKCLTDLHFQFIANRADGLVEYEIPAPNYFRVLVERRTDAEVHNYLILPSIHAAKGCTIDLRFSLDQNKDQETLAKSDATRLLKALLASLPGNPGRD